MSWGEVTGRFGEVITLRAGHAPHRLRATITCRKYSDCPGQEPLAGPRSRARRLAAGVGEGRTKGA